MAFFWPLFRKAQLCGVYGLKLSYGQIFQSLLWSFAALSWLSLVSLLPLINAHLACSLSFDRWPSLGRFVVVASMCLYDLPTTPGHAPDEVVDGLLRDLLPDLD